MIMTANKSKRTPHRANGKKGIVNVWLNTHLDLNAQKKQAAKDYIMQHCEWSQNTFYTKMKSPEAVRQIEKPVIAKAYGKSVIKLFPES